MLAGPVCTSNLMYCRRFSLVSVTPCNVTSPIDPPCRYTLASNGRDGPRWPDKHRIQSYLPIGSFIIVMDVACAEGLSQSFYLGSIQLLDSCRPSPLVKV